MLTKYAEVSAPEREVEVLDSFVVPANAGDRRLSRLRRRAHRHEFTYNPRRGFIYVRSRAISSRCNDNFDEFPAEEIKKAYATFVGKPVFVNHHNADHRRARGVIIDAALHEDTNPDGTEDTWAEVLMEVDAVNFPVLAREVKAGNIARTSMGTDVEYSECTACGNRAVTPADYCQHIPKMKGMKIRRAAYTSDGKVAGTEEVLIAERCYGLRFFENSLLVEDPADPTAFVLGVHDGDEGGVTATAAKAIIEEAESIVREANAAQHQRIASMQTTSVKSKADFLGDYKSLGVNHVWDFDKHPLAESMESYGFHFGNDVIESGKYDRDDFDSFHEEVVDVPLDKIRYKRQQSHVIHPYVEYLASIPQSQFDQNDLPYAQRMPDGTALLMEGHHRAAAASLRGDRTLKMTVYGIWGQKGKKGFANDTRDTVRQLQQGPGFHPAAPPKRRPAPKATEPVGERIHLNLDHKAPGYGGGSAEHMQESAERGDREMERQRQRNRKAREHRGPVQASAFEALMQFEAGNCTVCNPGYLASGVPQMLCNSHAFMAAHGDPAFSDLTSAMHPGEQMDFGRISSHRTAALDMEDQGYVDGYLSRPEQHSEDLDYAQMFDIGTTDRMQGTLRGWGPTLPELIEENATPEEKAALPKIAPPAEEQKGWFKRIFSMQRTAASPEEFPVGSRVRYVEPNFGGATTFVGFDGYATVESHQPSRVVIVLDNVGGRRFARPQDLTLVSRGTSASHQHTAYGETKAPAKVDTMRAEACPVCGDDESYNGDKCSVCGYIQPPSQFTDPDLTKAREQDLRQEQAGGLPTNEGLEDAGDGESLQCNNCGEVFSAEGDAPTDAEAEDPAMDPDAAAAEDPGSDDPTDLSDLEDVDDDLDPFSDLDDTKDDDEKTVDDKVEEKVDEEIDEKVEDEAIEGKDPEKDPLDEIAVDPATNPAVGEGRITSEPEADGDTTLDGVVAPNQTCPVCGQGVLVPRATTVQSDGKEPKINEVGTDPSKVKETVAMNQPNPAAEARRRMIAAIAEQQGTIEQQGLTIKAQNAQIGSLTKAVATMAVAAGLGKHAAFSGIVRSAGLKVADNPETNQGSSVGTAPATTTEEAAKPDATDDVESVGAVPAPANVGVTPEGVTDVNNSDVTVNPPVLDNLQDVTAPTAGTDAVHPAAGDAEGAATVTVGTPSQTAFGEGDSGWKTSAAAARGEDQMERFMASQRLARLRITAGIETGEDLVLAQTIAMGAETLGEINAQVTALSAVASKTAAVAPPRHLVPQSAQARQAAAGGQPQGGFGRVAMAQPTTAAMGSRPGEDEWLVGSAEECPQTDGGLPIQ